MRNLFCLLSVICRERRWNITSKAIAVFCLTQIKSSHIFLPFCPRNRHTALPDCSHYATDKSILKFLNMRFWFVNILRRTFGGGWPIGGRSRSRCCAFVLIGDEFCCRSGYWWRSRCRGSNDICRGWRRWRNIQLVESLTWRRLRNCWLLGHSLLLFSPILDAFTFNLKCSSKHHQEILHRVYCPSLHHLLIFVLHLQLLFHNLFPSFQYRFDH